ncbi:hypothetical protein Aperf_G00000076495 [Anoplocephala perfoliata]
MESKTNEAHFILSSVPGVTNPQTGSLFASRHTHTQHSQVPVSHPQNYNAAGDNYNDSSIRPAISKRKLSPSSHAMNDRSVEGFPNGSPTAPKGIVLPFPSKRVCPNNIQSEMRPVAPATYNVVPNQNSAATLVNNIQPGHHSGDVVVVSTADAVLVQPPLPVVSEPEPSNSDKLDQVIEHVLTLARSDEPHESVFVLPVRTRELIPMPSPVNQESTPSSSLHTSPPLSPSCSPRLISPAFPNSSSANPMVITTHIFSRNTSVDHIPPGLQVQRPLTNAQTVSATDMQRERMRLQNSRNANVQWTGNKASPAVAMLVKPAETTDPLEATSFAQSKGPTQGAYFEPSDVTASKPVQQPTGCAPPRQILSKAPVAVAETKILPAQQSEAMQKQQQQVLQQSPNLQPRVFAYIPQRQVDQANAVFTVPPTVQQRPNISNAPLAVKKDSTIEFANQVNYPSHGAIISNGISSVAPSAIKQSAIAPIHPMQYADLSPKSVLGVVPPRKRPPASKKKKSPIANPTMSPGSKISASVGPIPFVRNPIAASQGLDFTQQLQVPQRPTSSQEAMNKLVYFDAKKFLSDPALEAFSSALPPSGSPTCPVLPSGDESWLGSCGVKYERSGFALKALIPTCDNDEASVKFGQLYLHQSLPHIVSHPTVPTPTVRLKKKSDGPTRVCASPEPLTLDNRMKSLWTNLRHTDSLPVHSDTKSNSDVNDSCSLLSMLKTPCSPREGPAECRSPHLQLYHIPNTCILKAAQPNHRSSTVDVSSIDSETGESVGGDVGKTASVSPESRVVFSVNSSNCGNLPGLIQYLCGEVGISQSNISFVGGEISIRNPAEASHSEEQIREFGTRLKSYFSNVSVRFESVTGPAPAKTTECSDVSSQMKWFTELQKEKADDPILQSSLANKYKEDVFTIVSISNTNRLAGEKCRICQSIVTKESGIRKKWDELSSSSSIALSAEQDCFVFCGDLCLKKFTDFLYSHAPAPASQSNTNAAEPVAVQTESRHPHQLVLDGVSNSVPVLLQHMSHKSLKSQSFGRKNSNLTLRKRKVSPKQKRWRDARWRIYKSDAYHVRKYLPVPAVPVDNESPQRVLHHIVRDHEIVDTRSCVLCSGRGDGSPSTTERLLCLGPDRWVHLNCAIWCYDIYESMSGSLHNVDESIQHALKTVCSHCGKVGAGLPCYNPRCSLVYHVPCAINDGCMFFNDRGMYCSSHLPRDHHSMRLPSLTVNRKVYATRDESAQVADVVRSENSPYYIRVGSLILQNVGQLLPHQIEGEHFHTQKYIYPVFYCSTRIFWSMRRPGQRSLYRCEIKEQGGRPLFQVTVIDKGLPDVILENFDCTELWREIAAKVQQLRKENGLIQNFLHLICGEEMFGLSEPNVVRAIESLPGVDNLIDYAFHFGRLQLISDMPLAINPSGCARSEPSFLTSLRRRRAYANSHEGSPKKSVCPHVRSPGRQMSGASSNGASSHDPWNRMPVDLTTKNSTLVSWSQQYRRLKMESRTNVVFGRSRIQGFGLFAAQDLEPNTIVIEYIGELIRPELANKREKEYEARNRGIYMFRLEDNMVIDATMCGGPARYINHSCQPNCFAKYVNFDNVGHIVIITKRKVEKGEELTYDYLFDFEDRTSKIPCLCGAVGCRKWMN